MLRKGLSSGRSRLREFDIGSAQMIVRCQTRDRQFYQLVYWNVADLGRICVKLTDVTRTSLRWRWLRVQAGRVLGERQCMRHSTAMDL